MATMALHRCRVFRRLAKPRQAACAMVFWTQPGHVPLPGSVSYWPGRLESGGEPGCHARWPGSARRCVAPAASPAHGALSMCSDPPSAAKTHQRHRCSIDFLRCSMIFMSLDMITSFARRLPGHVLAEPGFDNRGVLAAAAVDALHVPHHLRLLEDQGLEAL